MQSTKCSKTLCSDQQPWNVETLSLSGQKQVWLLNDIIKVMSIFGTKDRQVCYSKYLDSLSIRLALVKVLLL